MACQLIARFRRLVAEGGDLADRLEQGQAETPLCELFQALGQAPDSDPFTAVLLAITPEARTTALHWLYGPEYSVVSVNVVEKLGLVEIHLSERGFVLEHGAGQRQLFDQLDPFLQAISKTDNLTHPCDSNWMDPVRMGVTSQSGLRGVTLLVPGKPELLLEHPALLSRLSTRANLVVLAAPLHHELSESQQQALEALSASMDGIWPLLVVDELAEDTSLPEQGWWEGYRHPAVQLSPKLLTTHVKASMSPLLSEENEDSRRHLFITQHARRLESAGETLSDTLEQRLRQIDTRIRKEERKARAADSHAGDLQSQRGDWQKLRQESSEQLIAMGKKLAEQARTRRNGSDEQTQMLERFLQSLSEQDLEREEGHKSVKLTVSEDFVRKLLDVTSKGVRKDFERDINALHQQARELKLSMENRVSALAGEPQNLPELDFDRKAIWSSVENMFNVRLRYRGEMPKRGFWQRLKEGRQGAMSFMMIIGMLGMMFGATTLRENPLVGLILFLVFFGSIIYSFIGWRKDDEDRIAKELDKLRDGVISEVHRLVSEVQRELVTRMTDVLEQTKKVWSEELERLSGTVGRTLQQQAEQDRQSVRDRLRVLEQQKRELANLQTGINRLCQQSEALLKDCKANLRSQ